MHETEEDSLSLRVKCRDTLLLGEDEIWEVLSFVGAARDPFWPFSQVANIDTGEIKFVHGEEVKKIVCTYEAEVKKRLVSPA